MTTITSHPTQPAGTRRRQVVAQLLGAREFGSINWRRLMQDGALIRLHVRGSSIFWARLTYEDDLGIRVEDEAVRKKLEQWTTLGKKRLLPEAHIKALGQIESRARHTLKERSFGTEMGYFVPSTVYEPWRDTTDALQAEYLSLRDTILENHAALVREVLAEYEIIAADTYQRLQQMHPGLITESRQQFITVYCNRVALQIPTQERIRERVDFRYVLDPSLSQVGMIPTEQPEEEMLTPDAVRSQTQERERQRSVLLHDLRVHAQERVNQVLDSFGSTVVAQLRTLAYDVSCDVLATLQRHPGESMSSRSVMQLNHLVEQIRALNFYGDSELDRMMQHLEQIAAQDRAERQTSLSEIQQVLRAIATVTRSTLMDLEEEPRSARELDVPDFLPTETVRQARAELGLEMDAARFANLVQFQAEARTARAETQAELVTLWNYLDGEPQREPRAV